MKILHVGKYYPPAVGGMERFLQDLAEEQVRQGHAVTVFCHQTPHSASSAEIARESASVSAEPAATSAQLRIHRQPIRGPVLHTPLMQRPRQALQQIVHDFQPDIIHLHWPNPVVLWLLPRLLAQNAPVVVQWHSDTVTAQVSPWVKYAHRLIKKQETKMLSQASAIVCSSAAYAEHSPLLERFRDKCVIIPLGMNFQRLAEVQPSGKNRQWADQLWPENSLRLLSLGRLSFYKNLPLVLEAVALASDSERPIHLVIAGDGPERVLLKQGIEQLGIAHRVTLTGAVSPEQAAALMASAQVFVLASNDRAESFGLVLLEALWHGLPLVVAATPGSGMAEVVEKTRGGCLFKPNSPRDLLNAIFRAMKISNPATHPSQGDSSAQAATLCQQETGERLRREFGIEGVARQYTRLYQHLRDTAFPR